MDITNNTEAAYLFLFGISIIASFIDSIAGGGGLLTTPSMLLAPWAKFPTFTKNLFWGHP